MGCNNITNKGHIQYLLNKTRLPKSVQYCLLLLLKLRMIEIFYCVQHISHHQKYYLVIKTVTNYTYYIRLYY